MPPGTVADRPYPTLAKNDHYEVELVVALGRGGKSSPVTSALDHVSGHSLALDMTRRDLQRARSDEKKPWEMGKGFDHSAVVGQVHPVASVGHVADGAIWLKVDAVTTQSATLKPMIGSVAEQISDRSEAFELMPGDIIYRGTPENVAPVVRGDVIEIRIDRLPNLSVKIV